MYKEFKAKIIAGGYPSPTYSLTKTFGINTDPNATKDEMLQQAIRRVQGIVARDMCFDRQAVRVKSIIEL